MTTQILHRHELQHQLMNFLMNLRYLLQKKLELQSISRSKARKISVLVCKTIEIPVKILIY
jgi:hypothetical protein